MMWKNFMLSTCDDALFNWQIAVPDVDISTLKALYLDPAGGYTGVVSCAEKAQCEFRCSCDGLNIKDLSTGTTACCTRKVFGPKVPVSEDSLVRYSLSFKRFHAELCKQLGLTFSSAAQDNFFWELGTFKRGTARFLPVYISYYHVETLLEEKIKYMLADPQAQFALIVFDHSLVNRKTADALAKRNCVCVSMPELLRLEKDASLQLLSEPAHIFNIYKENEPCSELRKYPCDSGVRWQDIHLVYYDDQNISVWHRKEASMLCSYALLDMIDKRQNKPSKAFALLNKALQNSITTLPVPAKGDPHYSELVQRKKEINSALRRFFSGMNDGDPVIYDKGNACYCFRFQTKAPVTI